MKEVLLALATVGATLALAIRVQAQGILLLNNYDPGFGVFTLASGVGGPINNAPENVTYVEILAGPDSGSLTAIALLGYTTTAIPITDIGAVGTGSFFDNGFGVTTIAENSTGVAAIRGWYSVNGVDTTWAAAVADTNPLHGVLLGDWISYGAAINPAPWPQAVGIWGVPPGAPDPKSLSMTGPLYLMPVPEPDVLPIAGLVAAVLLLFRRRN